MQVFVNREKGITFYIMVKLYFFEIILRKVDKTDSIEFLYILFFFFFATNDRC